MAYNSLLHFKFGEQASLNSGSEGSSFSPGAVLITSDTKKIYIDHPGGSSINDRICLGDFQLVEYATKGGAETALNNHPVKEVNVLYVTVNNDDGPALWRYTGTGFQSLSSSGDVVKLKSDVAALQTSMTGKAPTSHAVSNNTYGLGSNAVFGHVMLSDSIDENPKTASDGVAATPLAVSSAISSMTKYTDDKADEILGKSTDGANANTVYGAKAAAAAAQSKADLAMPAAGGTFGGPVTLSGDPTKNLHAATKQYVDSAKASAIQTAANDATTKANAVMGTAGDAATQNTVLGLRAAITALNTSIDNVTNIMNFLGTTSTAITDGTTTTINTPSAVSGAYSPKSGDVVIDKNGVECVYDGSVWRVIGETTALATAVSNLEATVGTRPTSTTMDATLWEEVEDLRKDLGESNADASATSAFGRIKSLESWKTSHSSAYDTLSGTVGEHTTSINTLNTTVGGHTTSINTLNTTVGGHTTAIGTANDKANSNGSLYARVKKNAADITAISSSLGGANDAANATGSAFARIAANSAAITNLTTVLTWGSF